MPRNRRNRPETPPDLNSDVPTVDQSVSEAEVEALVRKYKGRARAIGMSKGLSREDAEDNWQESLMALVTHWNKRNDRSKRSTKTWVLVTVSRKASNYRRKLKRQVTGVKDELFDSLPASPIRELSVNELVKQERYAQIRKAMAKLPPVLGQAVELRYEMGLKVPEIANIMGCCEKTVRNRSDKAIDLLRKELQQFGETTQEATQHHGYKADAYRERS